MIIYYKVLFLDKNGKKRVENGLIDADKFVDAAVKIKEHYAGNLQSVEHLEYCDRNMITLPKDICQRFINEEDFSYEYEH